MMLPTSESRNNATAKRMWLGITYNQDSYGLVMMTEQLGFSTRLFFPVVKMGTQQETEAFDITPDDTLGLVETRELDAALATFGSQSVTLTVTEQQVCIENEQQSRVVVRTLRNRQLSLPLDVDEQTVHKAHDMACAASRMVDADDVHGFVHLNLQGMVNALLPATKVTTMTGNMGDMKGVHIEMRTLSPSSPYRERSAAANGRGGTTAALRVIGAHEKALFVYEDETACTYFCNDSNLRGSTPLPQGRGEGESLCAIISPDSAKRLRELLLAEVAGEQGEQGLSNKKVWLKQLGEEYLVVCCGQWLMRIDLEDICQQDCEELLNKRGTHVYELKRTALLQAVNGLLLMGETEAFVTLADDCIWLEGESQAQRGKLRVDCQHYGMDASIPVRKYALKPMAVMLSAACVAENNKNVKLLADPDDEVLGIECEEYMVFVR